MMVVDRPRLVSLRQQRREEKIDIDLGRKADSSKRPITLPSLNGWGGTKY
ncbi:MAG: hypothetical protein WC807_14555 [Hyphomicrobium sp.]|jgi:hypothetical protein